MCLIKSILWTKYSKHWNDTTTMNRKYTLIKYSSEMSKCSLLLVFWSLCPEGLEIPCFLSDLPGPWPSNLPQWLCCWSGVCKFATSLCPLSDCSWFQRRPGSTERQILAFLWEQVGRKGLRKTKRHNGASWVTI